MSCSRKVGRVADAIVTVQELAPIVVAPGAMEEGALQLTVAPGFHIQANPASGPFLIPASLELRGGEGIRLRPAIYPGGEPYRLQGTNTDLMTYGSTTNIRLPVEAAKTAAPGTRVIHGALRYQACDERSCLFPASIPVTLTIHVAGKAADPTEEA